MKKLVVAVFSVIAINILLFCPFSEAYSLDDIKRDYPTLEINIYNSDGTFGRSLKILGLSSGKNLVDIKDLEFVLCVYPNNNSKNVMVYASHLGKTKMNILKVAIDNGFYNFYPELKFRKSAPVEDAYFEMVCVYFDNQVDFYKWKNAQIIQIVGASETVNIYPPNPEYAIKMNIIQKFLFE